MTTEAAFDPSVFAEVTADTADLEILHPATGELTGWIWTFAGPGHPQQRALADRIARKSLAERRDMEAAQVNRKKYKPEVLTPEQARAENIGHIADQVVSWTGSKVPFSRAAVIEMLIDPKYFDLFRQVTEFLEREKAFMKASATN